MIADAAFAAFTASRRDVSSLGLKVFIWFLRYS